MIGESLSRIFPWFGRQTQQMSPLAVDTPEALAGVLINRFDSALYAIPKALHGRSGAESLEFLNQTVAILADIGGEGGYEARRDLLQHFINLMKRADGSAMKDLSTFLKSNDDLASALAWDGRANSALAVIDLCSLLLSQSDDNPLKIGPACGEQSLADEELEIWNEWNRLRGLLSEFRKLSHKAVKENRISLGNKKNQKLKSLNFLGFLTPAMGQAVERVLCSEPKIDRQNQKMNGSANPARSNRSGNATKRSR
jgi:hypothetical protein